MTTHHDRLRTARQVLVMELYERRQGSDNDVPLADAIEELVFAAISVAFATHPTTKDAFATDAATKQ
jgi:hypothetical protein